MTKDLTILGSTGSIGTQSLDVARKHGIPNTARLPIDPKLAAACDNGAIESFEGSWLDSLADAIEKL